MIDRNIGNPDPWKACDELYAEVKRLRAENERLRETLDNVRQYIVEDIPEWALAAIRKGLFPD